MFLSSREDNRVGRIFNNRGMRISRSGTEGEVKTGSCRAFDVLGFEQVKKKHTHTETQRNLMLERKSFQFFP